MENEELENKAIDFFCDTNNCIYSIKEDYRHCEQCTRLEDFKSGYEQGIKDGKYLGKRCIQLQKDKGNLIDENEDLKKKIEKLKVCGTCKHWRYSGLEEDYICVVTEEIKNSCDCYKGKNDKCDKWESEDND